MIVDSHAAGYGPPGGGLSAGRRLRRSAAGWRRVRPAGARAIPARLQAAATAVRRELPVESPPAFPPPAGCPGGDDVNTTLTMILAIVTIDVLLVHADGHRRAHQRAERQHREEDGRPRDRSSENKTALISVHHRHGRWVIIWTAVIMSSDRNKTRTDSDARGPWNTCKRPGATAVLPAVTAAVRRARLLRRVRSSAAAGTASSRWLRRWSSRRRLRWSSARRSGPYGRSSRLRRARPARWVLPASRSPAARTSRRRSRSSSTSSASSSAAAATASARSLGIIGLVFTIIAMTSKDRTRWARAARRRSASSWASSRSSHARPLRALHGARRVQRDHELVTLRTLGPQSLNIISTAQSKRP